MEVACKRCGGLIVIDHPLRFCNSQDAPLSDFKPTRQAEPYRCLNCGEITDERILQNRTARRFRRRRTIHRNYPQRVC
jgi:hypothetical protein